MEDRLFAVCAFPCLFLVFELEWIFLYQFTALFFMSRNYPKSLNRLFRCVRHKKVREAFLVNDHVSYRNNAPRKLVRLVFQIARH